MTDEFWIRCRTCDGDGPHGWVCLPTLGTRGRWAVEHRAETGHGAWQVHDGTLGELTARLHRELARQYGHLRALLDEAARLRGLE